MPKPDNYLNKIPFFSNLTSSQLNLIKKRCIKKFYPENYIVIDQGDKSSDLFIILSGTIKVSLLNNEGREIVLASLGKNDFFGELSVLDSEKRSAMVTAKSDVHLLILKGRDMLQILKENHTITMSILSVLVRRLRQTNEKIESLAFIDVCGRVAKLLTKLSEKEKNKTTEATVILRGLTHRSIAEEVGASRESVTKALKSLSQQGLISIEGRKIIVYPS